MAEGIQQQQQRQTEAPAPQLPFGSRQHLACRICHMILSQQQFVQTGCQNCGTGPIAAEELHSMASTKFSGYVGIVDSSNSWIARLIGCSSMPSGVYAANVEDENDGDEGDDDGGGGEEEEEEEADADKELEGGDANHELV